MGGVRVLDTDLIISGDDSSSGLVFVTDVVKVVEAVVGLGFEYLNSSSRPWSELAA